MTPSEPAQKDQAGSPGNRYLVGGAAAACAVCCAAPIVGLLGVAGAAATAVTFAGLVFALVVALATAAALAARRRRARRTACAPSDDASTGPQPLTLEPTRLTSGAGPHDTATG